MLKFRATLLTLFSCTILAAQEYFPANGEVKTKNNNYTALTNAKIFVSPSQVLEKGTLLIRNGKVVKVGKSVDLPENTVVVEAAGRWIYPSFIDIFSDFGISKPEKAEAEGGGAGEEARKAEAKVAEESEEGKESSAAVVAQVENRARDF